ncbi:MAG TPA: bifunctional chorismate mutase/prephenate dehydratase [Actinobacteria bacterium]|nr:bifunctional chorismate mutase/prephenate dehydratase [Actinomycetota bacterium]
MRAGYQGEPGAFSEQAVRTLLPEAEPVPHRTFGSVFEAVVSGDLRYGIVPIENSQAGSINDTYDLLARHHLWIGGEVSVRVDQALLALPGTRLEDVRRVSSHPQALAQSAEFLAALDAEVVPEYDTAGAARRIAEQRLAGEAAVASERAAELYGLEVLARRIQTHGENHTRFVAVAVASATHLAPDKTSLVFRVAQEAIRNVVNHSQATKVITRLRYADGVVTLRVEDNGRGFSSADRSRRREEGHVGLSLLNNAVEASSGRLSLESEPGRGTSLMLTLPC